MLSFLCLQFRSTEMQFYCVAVIVLFGSCQCLHEVVHFDCILAIILFQSGKNSAYVDLLHFGINIATQRPAP